MHLTRGRISACVATYVVYLLLLISVDETCMLCVCAGHRNLSAAPQVRTVQSGTITDRWTERRGGGRLGLAAGWL